VGRKLAAQLRVIRLADMAGQPFAIRSADMIGQSLTHCYVEDDDAGGRWTDIQSILIHRHPTGRVATGKWDPGAKHLTVPEVSSDQFVMYEDGLWSGLETVRRLKAMQAMPPDARIVLKFGVITDFGLLVARHAIRSLHLSERIVIDTASSELIEILGKVP